MVQRIKDHGHKNGLKNSETEWFRQVWAVPNLSHGIEGKCCLTQPLGKARLCGVVVFEKSTEVCGGVDSWNVSTVCKVENWRVVDVHVQNDRLFRVESETVCDGSGLQYDEQVLYGVSVVGDEDGVVGVLQVIELMSG